MLAILNQVHSLEANLDQSDFFDLRFQAINFHNVNVLLFVNKYPQQALMTNILELFRKLLLSIHNEGIIFHEDKFTEGLVWYLGQDELTCIVGWKYILIDCVWGEFRMYDALGIKIVELVDSLSEATRYDNFSHTGKQQPMASRRILSCLHTMYRRMRVLEYDDDQICFVQQTLAWAKRKMLDLAEDEPPEPIESIRRDIYEVVSKIFLGSAKEEFEMVFEERMVFFS